MAARLNTETFVARAKEAHGERYDYSKTKYINSRTKVEIYCKTHGKFLQSSHLHLAGSNCPKCVGLEKMTTSEFINKAKELHGCKYDYSKVDYKNNKSDVIILCPKHGEFLQKPNNHLSGHGCTFCGNNVMTEFSEFLIRAREIHGGKYKYSKVGYSGSNKPVSIVCREHGLFIQNAGAHLKGSGCPKCYGNISLTTEEFVSMAKEVHGGRYSYEHSNYINQKHKVVITCPIHGEFNQNPYLHLQGGGCRECSGTMRLTTEQFISNAKAKHGDLYDYSKSDYIDAKTKVVVICKKHGDFEVRPADHVHLKSGCPSCANHISKAEYKLTEVIESHGLEVIQSDRKILNGLELDLVIPEKKLAIEFNGIHWHSEAYGKDRQYHANKTKLTNKAGYRLIHVWEDDYNENPEREIKFILSALGLDDRKSTYARKTSISEIGTKVASEFLNKHHVQGSVGSSVKLGTFLGQELVGVTLFTKRKFGYELVRHANSIRVVGGLGKVVKHFHRQYETPIHSFCDLARHDGKSYLAAGFVEAGKLQPDYKYAICGKREHKFGFRLNSIKTKFPEVYSPDKSEREMMEEAGIPRVWDCGKARYIFG